MSSPYRLAVRCIVSLFMILSHIVPVRLALCKLHEVCSLKLPCSYLLATERLCATRRLTVRWINGIQMNLTSSKLGLHHNLPLQSKYMSSRIQFPSPVPITWSTESSSLLSVVRLFEDFINECCHFQFTVFDCANLASLCCLCANASSQGWGKSERNVNALGESREGCIHIFQR